MRGGGGHRRVAAHFSDSLRAGPVANTAPAYWGACPTAAGALEPPTLLRRTQTRLGLRLLSAAAPQGVQLTLQISDVRLQVVRGASRTLR